MNTNLSNHEKRWHWWARVVSKELGWPHCTGFLDYLVCDRSDRKRGRLEMVTIYHKTAKQIRQQIANIKRERRCPIR